MNIFLLVKGPSPCAALRVAESFGLVPILLPANRTSELRFFVPFSHQNECAAMDWFIDDLAPEGAVAVREASPGSLLWYKTTSTNFNLDSKP